jgi:dipeptidyl aminopeptidase/acylaminoacyl peptidase
VDNFNCPILLQQGDEDKVVPPNQAELMFEATTKKDIDSILIVYEGEQHGFRAKENVIHALETEYEFYCKAWKMEPVEPEKHGLKLGEKIVVQKKGE